VRIESAPGRIVVVAPTDYRRFAFGGTLSYIQEFLAGLDEEIAKQVSLIGVDPADGGASDPVREIRERTFPFLSVCRVVDERMPLRLRFAWDCWRIVRGFAPCERDSSTPTAPRVRWH